MSETQPPVLITVVITGDDGRLHQVPVLPPDGATEDMVPVWEPTLNTVVWKTAAELGFAPTPMLIDVPLVDNAGFTLAEADGTLIVCNLASTDAA